MASHTFPQPTSEITERPLTPEEGWDLLESLFGSMNGWFPEEGGPSEVFRKEREAWGE